MTKTEELLQNLSSFLLSQRRGGTTTLIENISKGNKVWVLSKSVAHANDFNGGISINSNLKGLEKKPVLIDNETLLFILELSVDKIKDLERDIKFLRDEINELKNND